ncbi:hypothetical protein RQP46_005574 [Phenoliferia psychrophenolica]
MQVAPSLSIVLPESIDERRGLNLATETEALRECLHMPVESTCISPSSLATEFPILGVVQTSDPTWHSSTALARKIIQHPLLFGAANQGNRTLELGAGSGLVGLVWKAMSDLRGDPTAEAGDESVMVASDYHKKTLEDLSETIEKNRVAEEDASAPGTPATMTAEVLDWKALHRSLLFTKAIKSPPPVLPFPFDTPFDTILASDVVYEPEHALHIHKY